jgi:hypothetical protein
MFNTKRYESFEDASRRSFEYHVSVAPVVLPIISLCVAGLIWWNPPSAWFVVLNVVGGVGLAVSWVYQMSGRIGAAFAAAIAFALMTTGGLMLDNERDFNFQLVQGLGLASLPLYIFALTQRKKLTAK